MVGRINKTGSCSLPAVVVLTVLFVFFLASCVNPLSKIIEDDEEIHLDTTPPVISVFTLTSENPATDRDITFTLEGSDDVTGVTGWLINETSERPDSTAGGWLTELPEGYQLSDGDGEKTVYAWIKDGAGNVSESKSFQLTLYTAGPSTSFTRTSSSPTGNPTITFELTGDTEVTEWYINETGIAPAPADAGWTATAPADHTFSSLTQGTHTLYAWGRNSGGLLSVRRAITVEISIAAPAISSPDGSLITGHEPIILTFSEAMSNTSDSFGGTIGTAGGNWDSGAYTDNILTVTPSGLWSAGAGRTLTVNCTNVYGVGITAVDLSYDIFHGTCVDDDSAAGSPDGSISAPYSTVQEGIDQADALYVTPANGIDAAVVRVAAGTYSVECTTSVYIADLIEGVSLYGGYATDFSSRNPATTISYLIDSSVIAASTSDINQVRAVNAAGAITTATVIDGFTVRLGTGGDHHCGISCTGGAAPLISNIIIQGLGNSNYSYGILAYQSAPEITYCTIDPGSSTTTSVGVSCNLTTSPHPVINNNTISGGTSDNETVAVFLQAGSNAAITNNTLNGGDWTGGSSGYCVLISESAPSVTNNIIEIYGNLSSTYGILELSGTSDPASVRNNDFNYDGDWYCDELLTTIDKNNYDSTQITTGEGTDYIFGTVWNNYSTALGLP